MMISSNSFEKMREGEDIFGRYLKIVWRRKFSLLIPLVLCLSIALIVVLSLPRVYQSDARVALDSRKLEVIELNSVMSRLPMENAALRTELDVLSSRSMASRVIERLDLLNDEDFLYEINGPYSIAEHVEESITAAMARAAEALNQKSLADYLESRIDYNITTPPPKAVAIDWLLGNLGVTNDGRSFTIDVSFKSQTPELSARIANAFPLAYLDYQVELKTKATQEASTWLEQRLYEIRKELEASEAAVQRFRLAEGLVEAQGRTTVAQQVNELTSALVSARSERAEAESQIASARRYSGGGDSVGALPGVIISPGVIALRGQLSEVRAELEEYRSRGAIRHPQAKALAAREAALTKELNSEMGRVIASLENTARAARKREADIAGALSAIEEKHGASGPALVRLNELEREAQANRTIYESFLNRYKETVEQETLATPEARLISFAEPRYVPSGPKRIPFIVLGLVVGGMLGVALAALRERLDRGVRRIVDVEGTAGISVFGVIPRVAKYASRAPFTLCAPHSSYGEAIRRSYATLTLSRASERTQAIMVTSATSGEGKTSYCLALANSLAMNGLLVLVVDADLRRSSVARAIGAKPRVPLGDAIRNGSPLSDAVIVDTASGVHVLGAESEAVDPQSLLRSDHFRALMRQARDCYDVIIVDTPPVMVAPDAAIVGTLTDANLFLVKWESTPIQALEDAIRYLKICGTKIEGIVMSQVDIRRYRRYEQRHYYDIDYYRSSYIQQNDGSLSKSIARLTYSRDRQGITGDKTI